MAAGSTYTPLATTTLGSDTASVTFSSISGSYTDLVLVVNGGMATQGAIFARFNSDTGGNYSVTRLYGDGSTATSDRFSSAASMDVGFFQSNLSNNSIIQIMNYSNATTYKTVLNRWNSPAYAAAGVGLWRSTAAINAVTIYNTVSIDIKSGTTFTLYGIAAA
jgi:hypothetical protein